MFHEKHMHENNDQEIFQHEDNMGNNDIEIFQSEDKNDMTSNISNKHVLSDK
jgi:hypothetical protein